MFEQMCKRLEHNTFAPDFKPTISIKPLSRSASYQTCVLHRISVSMQEMQTIVARLTPTCLARLSLHAKTFALDDRSPKLLLQDTSVAVPVQA